ncbi:MAG: type II toxin-antitoxin system RelE/ParE family toxin [Polyangiaceae bacterium]|nr:type II toxin-antitoxin system RelE/ParE family toxin [Polyangiaceae bacterium]
MIRFRPAAARELAADVRYYNKHYVRVEEAPNTSPLLYEPDIRSAKVDRFPYRVVFLVAGDEIDVLAVAHAKRRPAYWRRRVK